MLVADKMRVWQRGQTKWEWMNEHWHCSTNIGKASAWKREKRRSYKKIKANIIWYVLRDIKRDRIKYVLFIAISLSFLRWKPIAELAKARSACVCLSKFISFWHRFLFSGHFFSAMMLWLLLLLFFVFFHFVSCSFVHLLCRQANVQRDLLSFMCVLKEHTLTLALHVYIETFK